jgi:hypothetical protein
MRVYLDSESVPFNIILGTDGIGLRILENGEFFPQLFKMYLRPGGF